MGLILPGMHQDEIEMIGLVLSLVFIFDEQIFEKNATKINSFVLKFYRLARKFQINCRQCFGVIVGGGFLAQLFFAADC